MLHTSERPTSFDQMLGNKAVINSLTSLLKKPDRPHCYMFTGNSGYGKTCLSRICASMVGALDVDTYEYNMADTKGIDTAREIINNMAMAPLGKATVIILDEVHRSMGNFQEALLKPTEDVPDHVYFFMATTAPNKIIPTLKRRFTQFHLTGVDNMDLFVYLVSVAKRHKVQVSKKVLELVVDHAHGSTAQALLLLETISGVDEKEQVELIEKTGEGDEKTVRDLCQALLYSKSWITVSKLIKEVQQDPESIRHVVMAYMTTVLLGSNVNLYLRAGRIIELFIDPFYTKAELVLACYKLSRA